MMRSMFITILMNGIMLLVLSCATVPTEPLASGELRLLSISNKKRLENRINVPIEVSINFQSDGNPEIRAVCFYWTGEGPHCYKAMDVNYGAPGTIKVNIIPTKPGAHDLEGYVVYNRGGKGHPSNIVSTNIKVHE